MRRARIVPPRPLAIALSLALSFATGAHAAANVGQPAASRGAREAAFLRTVDPQNTANVVTGDLVRFTGTHVAYTCDVEQIVKAGLILGQCGSEDEPMDLFVHLATGRLRVGERLRVLGVMESPAVWADGTGHVVYYAFLRALFVDP